MKLQSRLHRWRKPALLLAAFFLTHSVQAASLKIEFLPPPMVGTYSIGVFDKEGKLVRILHREAPLSDFKTALNGLITEWDGKNDAGEACEPGQYQVRGFCVGDLELEGVAFHGNDWMLEEDSPRLTKILSITPSQPAELTAHVVGQSEPQRFQISEGKDEEGEQEWKLVTPPEAAPEVKPSPLKFHLSEKNVKAEGADGKIVFEIGVDEGEPIPKAAYANAERLYLLEENREEQQVRAFDITTPEPTLLFEKSIWKTGTFEEAAHRLFFTDEVPFVRSSALKIALVKNPLIKRKNPTVEVQVLVDAGGATLATIDGLPLEKISDTPFLKWAAMGRPEGKKIVTLFESDGAVIEEFKGAHLSRMMAFDAGSFKLAAPVPAPSPDASTPAAEATATPEAAPSESPKPTPEPTPEATGASPAPTPLAP